MTCLDTTNDTKKEGFLAFLRLIGTSYFKSNVSAFEATSLAGLCNQIDPAKSQVDPAKSEEERDEWKESMGTK